MRTNLSVRNLLAQPYFLVNGILFLILGAVFVYAAMIPPTTTHYPVPSVYNRFMEKPSPTSGLSHSFSAMIRGDFYHAKKWNPYGPRLFFFFLGECVLRILIIFLLIQKFTRQRAIVLIDGILAVTGFVVAYGPLLLFWKYI